MELKWLDLLGEWNPQMFRELKGRLKLRNVLITVFASLVGQFLLFLSASRQTCLRYGVGGECAEFDWHIEWMLVFKVLNWVLPLILLVGGVYILVADLAKEDRRGTLNFIRLSPQSSQSILLGKVLGVPSLIYLVIALAVPLHLASAVAAGVHLGWVVGLYTLWGAACCLFYSAALLITLLVEPAEPQFKAAGSAFVAWFLGTSYISLINFCLDLYRLNSPLSDWKWWNLPVGSYALLLTSWTLIAFGVATYWFWQAVNRIYCNPKATLLSKQQSYWLVTTFELWLFGFVLPTSNSDLSSIPLSAGNSFLFILNPIFLLFLSMALLPNRQALLDWARYRRNRVATSQGLGHRSLVQDLIFGEKSPPLVAIAINLMILATIWVPWILLWPQSLWPEVHFKTQQAILGLLVTINLILIYAAIAQVMLLSKTHNPGSWLAGTVSFVMFLPLAILALLQISPQQMPLLWLFSPLAVVAVASTSVTTVFLGLLGQWSILGLLSLQLTRQLVSAGESTTKALFANPLK